MQRIELNNMLPAVFAGRADTGSEVWLRNLTLERGKAIEAAEDAYDALTDEQKALVENYDTLLKARAEYNKLKAEYVEGLIEKLPKADEITLKDGDNVKAAGDAYDKLNEDQKNALLHFANEMGEDCSQYKGKSSFLDKIIDKFKQ